MLLRHISFVLAIDDLAVNIAVNVGASVVEPTVVYYKCPRAKRIHFPYSGTLSERDYVVTRRVCKDLFQGGQR